GTNRTLSQRGLQPALRSILPGAETAPGRPLLAGRAELPHQFAGNLRSLLDGRSGRRRSHSWRSLSLRRSAVLAAGIGAGGGDRVFAAHGESGPDRREQSGFDDSV